MSAGLTVVIAVLQMLHIDPVLLFIKEAYPLPKADTVSQVNLIKIGVLYNFIKKNNTALMREVPHNVKIRGCVPTDLKLLNHDFML